MTIMKPKTAKRKNSAQRLREIAFHEAGHAVVMFWFELPVKYVSIRATKQWQGVCQWDDFSKLVTVRTRRTGTKNLVGQLLQVYLAGSCAEFYLTGSDTFAGASKDLTLGLALVKKLVKSEDEIKRFVQQQMGKILRLMNRSDIWSAVCELAARLLVEHEIDGAKVAEIIDKTMQQAA
jgi:ATP-dependent Zn protease